VPDAPGRASYLAYRGGAELARALPPALGFPLTRAFSRALTYAWPSRRRQVERNLQRASGGTLQGAELRRASSKLFENYGRYWYEMFRLRADARGSLEERFHIEGYEHLVEAEKLGKGAVMALPHLGNWDFAGAWLAGRGHKLTVVTEPVEPPELFEWFSAERAAFGMEVVALGPDSVRPLVRALEAGRVLCLVCDRDLTGDGVTVEFFGEPTVMPAGPAVLALRTGAPLIPTGVYLRPNGRHAATMLPPIPTERTGRLRDDVARVTQDLARHFEDLIAAAPEQWLIMQPVWPDHIEAAAREVTA
jgi:phosphatidylinositol dimannoside acyltransferase